MMKEMEPTVSTQVKEDMYVVIVDGFQLLSEWTGRVWEQSAWKFSRPTTELSPFDTDRSKDVSDYEKVKKLNHPAALFLISFATHSVVYFIPKCSIVATPQHITILCFHT
jgi:hypothetical protein